LISADRDEINIIDMLEAVSTEPRSALKVNAAFRFAVALFAALALASCEDRGATYRYKLTLSLDTPEGVKTGFDIIEITYSPTVLGHTLSVKGQALYMDLGVGREPLVALLSRIRRKSDDFYLAAGSVSTQRSSSRAIVSGRLSSAVGWTCPKSSMHSADSHLWCRSMRSRTS
jgi:hypothetical protein